MNHYCYLFEAKSIQRYILDSGKLRDLAGASELIDSLCRTPLEDVVDALEITKPRYSRRTGGAFYAFFNSPEDRDSLSAIWPLVVRQYAPGLDFNQASGQGKNDLEAFESASTILRENQSRGVAEQPQSGPRVHRSQRTGRAAVQSKLDPDKNIELLDATTRRQRHFIRRDVSHLWQRFSSASSKLKWEHWPIDLTPPQTENEQTNNFPFVGDKRYIAVLHADGNGLGQLLLTVREHIAQQAPDDFVEIFHALSQGIEAATQSAAQQAVDEILAPARSKSGTIAARPIVLGGDDLTMIVRADLALPFTECFLRGFAEKTGPVMEMLKTRYQISGLDTHLSACAGIAYIKASQPIYLAEQLAEGITRSVKRQAKAIDTSPPPSSLGFHRVTTAMIEEYDNVIAQEMTIFVGNERYCKTLGAYTLETKSGLPEFSNLLKLQDLMNRPDMASGPTRQLLSLIAQSPQQAESAYRRWQSNMEERFGKNNSPTSRFKTHLHKLLGDERHSSMPYRQTGIELSRILGDAQWATPLGDLHALLAVDNQITVTPDQTPAKETSQ